MNTYPLSRIVIKPNRQRQEFDPEALQELVTSIEDRGLMHPPVLRQEGQDMVLVAGERRLRAIAQIFELGGSFRCNGQLFGEGPLQLVPYTNLGDLDELEAEEAELDENLKRRDLTWQELAAAHDRLHRLRVKQRDRENDEAKVLEQPVKPAHTIADTAQELTGRRDGSYQDNVRKELIVAKYLDNPEVAKAKSVDEAFKILKRDEQRKENVKLATAVGATFNADDHQLLQGNCIDLMRQFADGPVEKRFDVICTDPPYGMNAQNFGDGAGKLGTIDHQYDDSPEAWRILMTDWAALAYAITKPEAHAYVFCDIDRFHELKLFMTNAGWDVFRTPFVVHKLNSGRVPRPEHGPRRQYELILYAIKGNKQVTHIYPDVIAVQGDENVGHGAQKPVALYQNLLQRSVKPGDRVIDTFAGSGTIFEAAHGMKCYATGIEQNPEYYGMSLKRLKQLKAMETPALF